MNKEKFLEVLKQSLEGEVKPEVIEQNIRYYDQYIGNAATNEQERILNDLGDPRLLAKTIIESEKAAQQRKVYSEFSGQQNYYDEYQENQYDNDTSKKKQKKNNFMFFSNLKWYQKIVLAVVLLFLIFFVIVVSGIILRLLFAFAVPILIIAFLLMLFRQRR